MFCIILYASIDPDESFAARAHKTEDWQFMLKFQLIDNKWTHTMCLVIGEDPPRAQRSVFKIIA